MFAYKFKTARGNRIVRDDVPRHNKCVPELDEFFFLHRHVFKLLQQLLAEKIDESG
jgi:hypothetical protein